MNVGDAHHEPAFISSGDAHPAADALTDDTLALMSYNIGIQNNEIPQGRKLGNWGTKWQKLQDDVKSAFTHETGIQVLLLSEFGNMFDSIDKYISTSGVSRASRRRCRPSTWRTLRPGRRQRKGRRRRKSRMRRRRRGTARRIRSVQERLR